MSEAGKQTLENMKKLMPKMSDSQVDKLLAFTEGMALMHELQQTEAEEVKENTEITE